MSRKREKLRVNKVRQYSNTQASLLRKGVVGSSPGGGSHLCPAMEVALGSAVTSGHAVCGQDGDRGLRHCLNCRQLLVLVAGLTVLGSAPGSSGSSSDPGCRREKLTLGQGISSTQETNAVERAVWLLNCRPVAQSIALRSSRNSAGGSE